ncbi:MBL fold metallo-hydrolase [Muricoccus vinaceus]|uniref:MBL fold metallo-hydrolase n=1 Tax=Muricoccus vinaceus TaxID=424704 RepID=A0ABV6IUJ8_9PROT
MNAGDGRIVVTLLGTGTPNPSPQRFGPATLVQAGGLDLLFDAGRGCTIRLAQCGLPLGRIAAVFLTHFHSDHVNGLADVWMSSYVPPAWGGRRAPMRLFGPPGTARMAHHLREAFADDIRIRMADERVPEEATRIEASDFPATGGVVLEEAGVRVTAFEVDHGRHIRPAVGFRIDHAGRSVLLSGDTKPHPNLRAHGAGVDLLVHEVCALPPALRGNPVSMAIADHHTSPEEAGEIFAATRPALAAFTHIVQIAAPGVPRVPLAEIEDQTRRTYGGPLVMGEDLMRFTVTAEGVATERLS